MERTIAEIIPMKKVAHKRFQLELVATMNSNVRTVNVSRSHSNATLNLIVQTTPMKLDAFLPLSSLRPLLWFVSMLELSSILRVAPPEIPFL